MAHVDGGRLPRQDSVHGDRDGRQLRAREVGDYQGALPTDADGARILHVDDECRTVRVLLVQADIGEGQSSHAGARHLD